MEHLRIHPDPEVAKHERQWFQFEYDGYLRYDNIESFYTRIFYHYTGSLNMIRACLDMGCPINFKGLYERTILSDASRYYHDDVVEFLLTVPGVDVNSLDKHKRTPLDNVFYSGWYDYTTKKHIRVVLLLLKHSARRNCKETHLDDRVLTSVVNSVRILILFCWKEVFPVELLRVLKVFLY